MEPNIRCPLSTLAPNERQLLDRLKPIALPIRQADGLRTLHFVSYLHSLKNQSKFRSSFPFEHILQTDPYDHIYRLAILGKSPPPYQKPSLHSLPPELTLCPYLEHLSLSYFPLASYEHLPVSLKQ